MEREGLIRGTRGVDKGREEGRQEWSEEGNKWHEEAR